MSLRRNRKDFTQLTEFERGRIIGSARLDDHIGKSPDTYAILTRLSGRVGISGCVRACTHSDWAQNALD
ncbi:hypothetical protein ANN_13073 [Periplaneta americana]|uniref:Uncharacterized protein n=1 Tax=Periplaneta americana TaxID=6978 RepID=A0ABQ8TK79_PERAM|nr:hypothetical protein ANN_13073 [Periplaneta americana]